MKIAAATQQGGLDDKVSAIVGRTPTFTVVETSNEEIIDSKVIQNDFNQAQSGAGIKSAQMLANKGIQAIIGGNFGSNLARVFTESGIKMYQENDLTVEEATHQLLRGELSEAGGSTSPPDRGKGRGRARGSGPGQHRGINQGKKGLQSS